MSGRAFSPRPAFAFLAVILILVACNGGSVSSPSPAADTTPPSTPEASPTSTDGSPVTSPIGPGGSPEAAGQPLIPAFPGAEEVPQDQGLVARASVGAVDESEYVTIFRAQYQTTASVNDVQAYYVQQMRLPPFSWEQIDWFGSAELRRGVYGKDDGRYAAWVLNLQASGVGRPTIIVLELGERIEEETE